MALPKKKPSMLRCSGCGTSQEAACDCGVGYMPAGEWTALAVADPTNQHKNNVQLAKEIGVHEKTVRGARKSISEFSEIEQTPRMRSNGRPYPAATKKPKLHVVTDDACDLANTLDRDFWNSFRQFEKRFDAWVASGPPDEAKDMLHNSLRLCAEELLRLASDISR